MTDAHTLPPAPFPLMNEHNWSARNKTDLIIEVWEKLDCESVGEAELKAIETVVRECYGENAADPPIVVARLLADEGAALRHPEIFEMDVRRRLNSPYDAMFRNLLRLTSLEEVERSLRHLENLRKKFKVDSDAEGLRLIKETALGAKEEAKRRSAEAVEGSDDSRRFREAAEWITIWLQSPEIFESWVGARRTSASFREEFGESAADMGADQEEE
jgi:hypothetical protein